MYLIMISFILADVDHVVDTGLFILRDKPDEDGNVLVSFTKHRDAKGVCQSLYNKPKAKLPC